MTGTIATAVVALALAGCATLGAGSHVDPGLDFTRYRTFDWGAPDEFPVGDPRLDKNPIFLDHLHGAVEKQLAARGYERVVTGRPQLLIHFHASIDRRLNVNTADASYGFCVFDACRAGAARVRGGHDHRRRHRRADQSAGLARLGPGQRRCRAGGPRSAGAHGR